MLASWLPGAQLHWPRYSFFDGATYWPPLLWLSLATNIYKAIGGAPDLCHDADIAVQLSFAFVDFDLFSHDIIMRVYFLRDSPISIIYI